MKRGKRKRDSNDNTILHLHTVHKQASINSSILIIHRKTGAEPRVEEKETHHEAECEGSDNGNGDRNGRKLDIADMADENASD